jgi:glycosyltransferase involved in cell wall biosynthesis
MKLIIQIPCYNEESTLPLTVGDLPREIPGIDKIETLVIDDGSSDHTLSTAEQIGVDHIVHFNQNRGLARAFDAGIEKCLELGADIIVNTDADNQYCGRDLPKLVAPILEGRADVAIGDRQIEGNVRVPWLRRKLQGIGGAVIRWLSQTPVRDAASGLRAYSRQAATRINTLTEFSYTFENIIQMGYQKLKVVSVPVAVNFKTRESRLFKNISVFLVQQFKTVLRTYATYKALKVFFLMGFIVLIPGFLGFLRFLYLYFAGGGKGHIQSLLFSTTLIIIAFLLFMIGLVADLISQNRKLIEKLLVRIREMEQKNKEGK